MRVCVPDGVLTAHAVVAKPEALCGEHRVGFGGKEAMFVRSCWIPLRRNLFCCCLGIGLLAPAVPASAGFVGDYDLSTFTLINTNADGAWSTPDAGLTLALTGGNNGSLLPGQTYFLTMALENSQISFHYLKTTLDDPTLPEVDVGGYVLGRFWPLTLTSDEGDASFTVSKGQGFGFSVQTADNSFGPATLHISDFRVLPVQSQVPEPRSTLPLLMTAAAWLAWRWNRG